MEKRPSRGYFGHETPKKGFFGVMVYAAIFFFVAVTVMDSAAARRRERTRTVARLNEFDNCRDKPRAPFRMTSRKVSVIGRHTYVINGEGVCEKATRKLEMVQVNITKCSDKTRTKCQHYNRLQWKGSAVICLMLDTNMTPWQSVISSFHPRISCENKKGRFTVRNMTMDFEQLSKLDLTWSDYYVTETQTFDDTNELWSCINAEVDFPKVRG